MNKSILIMGGKPNNINCTNVKNFDSICRVNLNMTYKEAIHKDIFYVNNHVYMNMFINKIQPEILKKGNYHYVDLKKLKDFNNIIKNNEYGEVIQQYESGKNSISNKILADINCPYRFLKAPRCGYQAILYFLNKNYKIYVSSFSFLDEINETDGNSKHVSDWHDTNTELKVLHWLHENNYIDATLCMLEYNKLPMLNCNYIEPKKDIILYFLKNNGICLLKNYYKKEIINKIKEEFDTIFLNNKKSIEILDKEDCSNDERIFHAERYSTYLKKNFSDNMLFNNIARVYNPRINKKTLINILKFEKGKVKNSGAGWHRDNHNCQFKTIMYLTNCNSKNGPFTWITNSSKRHIGNPKPRKPSYNTRFFDETIEEILEKNKNCEKIEVSGNEGDIILADTTYIHRGKIIEECERKAVTQYFF